MRSRHTRWLVFAPVAILSLFSPTASAEPIQGLQAIGYSVDAIPPTRSDTAYPTCGSEIENNINRNFDYEQFQQCPDDYFMVHYTGAITIPEHNTIEFWLAADDGGTISIGGNEFGTWDDKGCSATESGNLQLETGSHSLNAWFYENGGNTCFMLAWNINNAGWEMVPDEAFTTEITTTTTTTSTTTTTEPSTTTTTTTTSTTTTTEPDTTTTEPETTTTTDETTTSLATEPVETISAPTTSTIEETTTTVEEEPTTTVVEDEEVTTTTEATETVDSTESSSPQETNTTIEESPPISVPLDVQDAADEAVADIFDAPMADSELTEAVNGLLDQADTTEEFVAIIGALLEQELSNEEFATVIDTIFEEPLSDEKFDAVIDSILEQTLSTEQFAELVSVLESDTVTEEQVASAVDSIIEEGVTEEQATELATSEKVLESIGGEQATAIFEELPIDDLTVQEAVALVSAVQNAPNKVKKAFETTINVFGGVVDTYVPIGSNVPISTRRILVITSALAVVSLPTPKRLK